MIYSIIKLKFINSKNMTRSSLNKLNFELLSDTKNKFKCEKFDLAS